MSLWTRGTTESINMVAQWLCRVRICNRAMRLLSSVAEHHANLVPWLMVAQQTRAKVVKLPA
ncbi:aminotransferase class V-fold PLP-dependent enzyme [Escherichia coli]